MPSGGAMMRRPSAVPFQFASPCWPGLAKLTEECGEVVQVCAKVIGTGGAMVLRDGQMIERSRVIDELADLMAALHFVVNLNLSPGEFCYYEDRMYAKVRLFETWRHDDAADA